MKCIAVLIGVFSFLPTAWAAGAQPWARHTIDTTLAGADGVRLADLNGDGLLEIAVGWEQSGRSTVHINPGYEAARSPWPRIDVGHASGVEDANFIDLDGDGRLDVLSSRDGARRVTAHFAPASGDLSAGSWETATFPTNVVPSNNWMYSIAADINGDGQSNPVIGGKGDGAKIGWLEPPATNRRNVNQWQFHEIGEVGWTMSLIAADLNQDGRPDVVLSDRNNRGDGQGVRWLENPGPGAASGQAWTSHTIGARNKPVMFMDLVDMNGSGLLDAVVITSNHELLWYEQQPGLQWVEREIHIDDLGLFGRIGKSVRVGDVDRDGALDIVIATEGAAGRVGVYYISYTDSIYDPTWIARPISDLVGEKYDLTQLVDMDGDGDLDVLTTEEANNASDPDAGLGLIWYENPTVPEPGTFAGLLLGAVTLVACRW